MDQHRDAAHAGGTTDHDPGGRSAGPEPGRQMAEHHGMALWTQVPILLLGAWLITSPPVLGYGSLPLAISDVVTGGIVIALGLLALAPQRAWAGWLIGLVGAWVVLAPLLFWAPTAAEYLNGTLVGALLIAFAVLIPHGMAMPGPDVPPGWTYNPSSWWQRAPVIALGILGFFIARYMAAFQLGHIDAAWDPVFGPGTEEILTSEVSRAWPVSDSGLGAATYLFEALMGLMGDPRRWRTMPWMVAFFAILVVPLGVVSITLVILQPVAVGTWCTLCLVTALAMLVMIPLTLDEVVAMLQFLAGERARGRSLWRAFWLGGDAPDGSEDRRTPPLQSPARAIAASAVWGVTVPPALLAASAIGIWLLLSTIVLGVAGTPGHAANLLGALAATVAIIAMAEVARALRYLNLAVGAAIVAAGILLGGPPAHVVGMVLGGLGLVVLSVPRGAVRERYGSFDRWIR